jgi:hypothetical protein
MTIGLFGTCSGSAWREPFMSAYKELGLPFFNPQVANWVPELADVEAWHLAHDQLLLFPVTDESYGAGSLSETGFSILSALRWDVNRFVVVYIATDVNDVLKLHNPTAAQDSRRSRQLVKAHLERAAHPNVFVVNDLRQMLDVSLRLFAALRFIESARTATVDWQSAQSPDEWLGAASLAS